MIFQLNSLDGIRFDYIKIEEGSIATPNIRRTYSEILAQCKWYLRKSDGVTASRMAVTNGSVYGEQIQFPAMRVIPAITLTFSAGTRFSTAVAQGIYTGGFESIATATGTGNGVYTLDYLADARL